MPYRKKELPDEVKHLLDALHELLEKKYPNLEVTIEVKINSQKKDTN